MKETLLEAVLEDPDDLASRRVYADALIAEGDPRGELINVQCDLADSDVTSPGWRELVTRERELLAKHAKTWTAPFPFVFRPKFQRGFIEEAFVNTKKFVPAADELLEREPVRVLAMRDLTIRNAGVLGARPELRRLHTLRVSESSLGTKGITALLPDVMPRLRVLGLYQSGLDDDGLSHLGRVTFQNLERLDLSGTRVTTGALGGMLGDERLAKLRYLRMSWLLRESDGAQFLADHLSLPLTHLDVSSSQYTNEDLKVLASNSVVQALRGLRVEYNELGGTGAIEALAPLDHLEVLDLSSNAIDAGATAALAERDLPLRVLRLYQCSVTDEHLVALANAKFPLRRLDLGYGSITAKGLRAIGGAGWPLETLELWAAKIGDAGAAALAGASFTRTLRELVVGYNDFTDAALVALAAATWPRLERLIFRGDDIGEAGARALAEADMPALRYVKFEGMAVPKKPLAALRKRGVEIE